MTAPARGSCGVEPSPDPRASGRPAAPPGGLAAQRVLVAALAFAALSSCAREAAPGPDAGRVVEEHDLLHHLRRAAAELTDPRLRAELLGELARAHAGLPGQEATAGELLSEGVRAAEAAPGEDRGLALARLARAAYQLGFLVRGEELLARISTPEARDQAALDIARILLDRGDQARAAALSTRQLTAEGGEQLAVLLAREEAARGQTGAALDRARKLRPAARQEVQSAVVRAYAERRDLVRARSLADTLESGHWRSEAREAIALAQLRQGKEGAARATVATVDSAWIQARALGALARLAAAERRANLGRRLFNEAVNVATGIGDPVLRAQALGDLATHTIRQGNTAQTEELASQSPTEEGRARILAEWTVAEIQAGRLDSARRLAARAAGDPVHGADALTAVARAQSQAGDDAQALATLREIRTVELRLPALAQVAVAHHRLGRGAGPALVSALRAALELSAAAP